MLEMVKTFLLSFFFFLSSSFFNQPCAITQLVLHSKQPPVARKFSGSVHFELGFEHNCTSLKCSSVGKTEGAECTN